LTVAAASPFALSAAEREMLGDRLERGVRRARRSGGACLVGLSRSLPGDVDPAAIALSARGAAEPWMCTEQPERDRIALGALGAAVTLEDRSEGRFERVAAAWRALAQDAIADPPDGPPGAGLIACGGFAFAPGGGASAQWSGFAPASLVVPEIAIARRGEQARMTVAACAHPDDDPQALLERIEARVAGLRSATLPLLDPHPTGRFHVASVMAPEHFEEAVARAVERIRAGQFEKVVLAREVDVNAPRAYDAAAVLGILREAFGGCFLFCVGRGEKVFLAATPELLVRREGLRASTLALAGSTRRSADPAVDDHLGERMLRSEKAREEHEIVVRRIERALRPHAVWVAKAPEPSLAKIANIQHLATPIRAQLTGPVGAVELAGMLHPTPAVGAEPGEAVSAIPALEGIDRGWYTGAVGWTDASEDGEFCVALRCALLDGAHARLYAGNGIVGGSDPADELAETEVKLQALLPLLSG
jgi:salicylate biosynthesis isochorismate synthase/menaquinone-specific isochorismate synthase